MSNTNFTSRIAAAVSAFALSLVMISGTVSVPSSANAHDALAQNAALASTYVGVVA